MDYGVMRALSTPGLKNSSRTLCSKHQKASQYNILKR